MDKIIVRGTNWIGDAVMTLPALESLAEGFPDSEIHVCARPWVAPVYQACESVHQVLVLERSKNPLADLMANAATIKKGGYGLGITLANSFDSALLLFAARVPERVGYSTDSRRLLLTQPVPLDEQKGRRHEIFYYLNLISALTGRQPTEMPRLRLVPGRGAMKGAKSLLKEAGLSRVNPLFGFNPGAAYGPAKCWPEERYVLLGKMLLERFPGAGIVILGTAKEQEAFSRMARSIGEGAVSLAGRTSLPQVFGIISMLHLLVTNDSGLMHVAAATGTRLVAIFGSTNPVTTGPWSDRAAVVRRPLPCSPCLKRSCPGDFECMTGISPEMVMEEVERLMEAV